jgi:hypothetical protein
MFTLLVLLCFILALIDISTLGSLLDQLGFDIGDFVLTDITKTPDEPEQIGITAQTASSESTSESSPETTTSTTADNDTDIQLDEESYDVTHVIASFDLLKRINASESNSKLLMNVFG